ncbi:MAG: hypothetical protein V3T07_02680 [Myxococcota bacterium]
MKKEHNRHLGKGIRDRCTCAQSLCVKLASHSDGLAETFARCFAPYLGDGEPEFDLRGLLLLLVAAIRQRIARLLDAERFYQDLRGGCAQARSRKNQAIETLHRLLTSYRRVGLWDHGPVGPPCATSRRPEVLLVEARRIRPHLVSPTLQLSPGRTVGIHLMPGLQAEHDAASEELEAALIDFRRFDLRRSEAKEDRDLAMADLDRYVAAARRFFRALSGCSAASRPAGPITATMETPDATGQRQSHRLPNEAE